MKKKHKRPKLTPIVHYDENDNEYRIVRENKVIAVFKPNDQGEFMFDEVGIYLN